MASTDRSIAELGVRPEPTYLADEPEDALIDPAFVSEDWSQLPAGSLALSVRAARVVGSSGCRTLGHIASLSVKKLASLRNVGRFTIKELQDSLRTAAGGSFPEARSSETGQDTLSVLGRGITASESVVLHAASVEHMSLPTRARHAAEAFNCRTVFDVAVLPRSDVTRLPNFGRRTLADLRQAVNLVLADWSEDSEYSGVGASEVRRVIDEMLSGLGERDRFVMASRYGLWGGVTETLEDVGSALGVTRERIRQAQAATARRLRHSKWGRRGTVILGNSLRQVVSAELARTSGILTSADLEMLLDPDAAASDVKATGDLVARIGIRFLLDVVCPEQKDAVLSEFATDGSRFFVDGSHLSAFQKFETEVKELLLARGRPLSAQEIERTLSKAEVTWDSALLERCAEVSDVVGIDLMGRIGSRRWKYFSGRGLATLVQAALVEMAEPAHHSRIVERVRTLSDSQKNIGSNRVVSTLRRYPDVFQSFGRGMFALCDWGLSRPPVIKEFIADFLENRGGSAHKDEIVAAAVGRYGFSATSVQMILSMNPTFFRKERGGCFRLV